MEACYAMEKRLKKKKQKNKIKHIDPYEKIESKPYESPIHSREAILDYFEKMKKPLDFNKLVKGLRYRDEAKEKALRNRLNAMVRDGQLLCTRRGSYALTKELALYKGIVSIQKDGYGIVMMNNDKNIIMPPRQAVSLMNGDVVLVRAGSKLMRGKRLGVLVDVITRANTLILGQYIHESGVSYIVPYGRQLSNQNVLVDPENHKINSGDYVVVEIKRYPSRKQPAMGVITKIIGESKATNLEIDLAILGNGIPNEWSKQLNSEVSKLPKSVSGKVALNRQDLRALPFVTIDGFDAKDFDDAVYVEPKKGGGWTLYVAIADVSHYVKPGSHLDEEAKLRGNSVYFPNHVVPMLPEVLSNGLCSLVPEQDRLVMVAKMEINPNGVLQKSEIFRGVIHSHARFTYAEVAKFASGKKQAPDFWQASFVALQSLYEALIKQRAIRGAIEFNTQDTTIIYDKDGRIDTIKPTKRTVAHCYIEECMLMANQAVAEYLLAQKIPAVYRVHADPPTEKIEQLRQFLGYLGIKLGGSKTKKPGPKDYNKVLKQSSHRKDLDLIQTVLLRSMAQAVYAHQNGGHFGLAYDAYCHFTSPIRRYPDLLVHRAIGQLLDGGAQCYHLDDLSDMALHCSFTERRADDASREVIGRLKCYYMRDKIGQRYHGKIVSVTSFGFFVCLEEIYVEGLVHITTLPNDYYQYEEERHQLIGKRLGKKYKLGDVLQIEVVNVGIEDGYIDFALIS